VFREVFSIVAVQTPLFDCWSIFFHRTINVTYNIYDPWRRKNINFDWNN